MLRDHSIGYGDPRAGYGEAVTRLSGMGSDSPELAQLKEMAAHLKQQVTNQQTQLQNDARTIANQAKEIALLTGIYGHELTIAKQATRKVASGLSRIG